MSLNRDAMRRMALLVGALVLALVLANMAASLYQVWELEPGATVPGPWNALLNADRATQRTHLLALVGVGALAGASLGCLLFVVERVFHESRVWLSAAIRK